MYNRNGYRRRTYGWVIAGSAAAGVLVAGDGTQTVEQTGTAPPRGCGPMTGYAPLVAIFPTAR
jgi:hypothetical protein